ncbi:chromatin associated protein KTI12 [Epithele typhae]|uniref:chromatin associated protein KTI12 n=1 Tax=Epithele typhae TaxID=378194 RepID=UPI002008D938|nr:chromatin associated protein KTI12 [Epithele typhae]KAH9942441.1 chromatin associated protein KTI12 [Epithele typhae]
MALVTVCGSLLRSHFQARLQDSTYEGPPLKIVVVSDDNLNLSREVYDGEHSPHAVRKTARAALFTAVQRQMGQDTVLIVDSMNYIKGFRYQIYCAAREHKLRVCTLFVAATHEQCKQWNAARHPDGPSYSPETQVLRRSLELTVADAPFMHYRLENLLMRFEEPSSMARWDSPLFTVPWTDDDVPADDIWKAVTAGTVNPQTLLPRQVPKAPTDALRTLEATATSMVAAIMASRPRAVARRARHAPLSATLRPQVALPPRAVTLSELQRLKRQFVTVHKKAITLGAVEKGAVDWSEESVAGKFAEYVEGNLKP